MSLNPNSFSYASSSRSEFKTSDLTYSRSSQIDATGVSADRLSALRGKGIRIEIMHEQCNTDGGRQAFLQKVLQGNVHSDSRIPSLVQFADAGIGDIAVGEIAERFAPFHWPNSTMLSF
ncbi:hypothetical protein MMC22_010411 [Lobaria immixta]|nr:hypothetical protein [Lobaria immixta]